MSSSSTSRTDERVVIISRFSFWKNADAPASLHRNGRLGHEVYRIVYRGCCSPTCLLGFGFTPPLIPTSATGEGHAVGQTTEPSAPASLLLPPRWAQRADPRAKTSSPGGTAPLFLLPHSRRARGSLARLPACAAGAVPHSPLNVALDSERAPVRYARLVQRRLRPACQPPGMKLVLATVRRQGALQRYHQAAPVRAPPHGPCQPGSRLPAAA